MTEQRYSPEEVEGIIRRAMRIEDERSISREDLVAAAMEVGIPQAAIEQAIDAEARNNEARRQREADRRAQRRRFRHKASGLLIIAVMLFLIDLLTHGGWWFHWPVLFMGVALALRARRLYFPG